MNILTREMMANHQNQKIETSAGGAKLSALRNQRNMSQGEVEVIAELGEGYLHRIESGRVMKPKRETIERILESLNVSFNDKVHVLEMFGYRSSILLPDDTEIERMVEFTHNRLQCGNPAYLIDCSTRLLAWNSYIPKLFGIEPDSVKMGQFRKTPVLNIIFDEHYGFYDRIENKNESFSSLAISIKRLLYLYKEEQWCQELQVNAQKLPLFNKYWEQIEHIPLPPTTPPFLLKWNVPGVGHIFFRNYGVPITQDQRFFVVELVPIDMLVLEQLMGL